MWAVGGSFCTASPELEIFGSQTARAASCYCIRYKYRGEVKAQRRKNNLESIMQMSPEPRTVPSPCSLPLCCSEKNRAEENHLLGDGWKLSMTPAYPSPAIPSEDYEPPLCWAVVSTQWVLISHFQLIHGAAEHRVGLASEATCFP